MKKLLFILLISGFILSVNAQFKEQLDDKPSIREGFLDPNLSAGSLFGFIDFNKFSMNHSVNMSYSSFAGQGVALGVYTNSMRYDFSDNLNVQVDASLVNSPYNTLGDGFTNSINGLYLSRAAINFKPSENTAISIQFRQGPGSYYNGYYSPYYMLSPSFERENLFHQTQLEK